MLLAMLVGAVIGTEREYTHRPAGMRTHMLVALGACAPTATPRQPVAQMLAAVVRPLMLGPSRIIVPAPKNPRPVMT